MNTIYIDYNSMKIAVHQNKSEGKAIVFIHGNSLSSYSWIKQMESNLAEEYRLILIDLPGHGDSDHSNNPDADYCVGGMKNMLKFVLESINPDKYILVGHSLGGHLCLEICEQLSNLCGVMIFGTPPVEEVPVIEDMFYLHEGMSVLFKEELTKEDIELYAKYMVEDYSLIDTRFLNQIASSDTKFRPTWGASAMGGGIGNEAKTVENLKFPIAILHGMKDPWLKISYFDKLRIPTLWENKVHVLDCGHNIQFEKSDEFNTLLKRFAEFSM